MPPAVEIEMKVSGGGLDVVMAQTVFYIRDRLTPVKHIHGPCMAEAVSRLDILESFWGKGQGEIFFANPIYAVTSQFFSPLIDKDTVLI